MTEPGIISSAYRQFHSYSIGNQLLAWAQCVTRGIQPGPLSTFMGWKEKGRHVKKGEKAFVLCQPVTIKRTREQEDGTEDGQLKGVEVQAVADALETRPFMLSRWRKEARDGVLRGRVSVPPSDRRSASPQVR